MFKLMILGWVFLLSAPAWGADPAATYPNKPIRIMGQGSGSTADYLSRYVGHKLTERWKQQVVVDNRSGAGGTISHLTGELFKQVTGVSLQHIPYKGAGAALTSLISGETQVSFLSPITAHAQLKKAGIKAD